LKWTGRSWNSEAIEAGSAVRSISQKIRSLSGASL
jgi:hypothetical protein